MATMTATAHDLRPNFFVRVARAVWNGMIALSELGPRMAALEQLSRMTDAQLEARGTTRMAEIERILGPRAAL